MKLLISIMFSLWSQSTMAQLPSPCVPFDTSSGRKVLRGVKCKDAFLGGIPSDLERNINYLEIETDLIENLTDSSFANYPRLEYLLLKHSGISFIEEHTFSSLTELIYVDLSGNLIEALPPLPPSVEILYLNSMVKRTSFFVSDRTFDNIVQLESSLKSLYIRNNKLRFLPSFVKKMQILEEIFLDNNLIDELTVDDFAPLCSLKAVDFAGNKIASAERNACNCQFVRKWAYKYNLRIHNLTCPQMPTLNNGTCERKFPQDLESADRIYSQCLSKIRRRKYVIYSAIGLIAFTVVIMGYCCFREKRRKMPKKINDSSSEHETQKIPEEKVPLEQIAK